MTSQQQREQAPRVFAILLAVTSGSWETVVLCVRVRGCLSYSRAIPQWFGYRNSMSLNLGSALLCFRAVPKVKCNIVHCKDDVLSSVLPALYGGW